MLGEQYIANGTNKARGVAIIFMKNSKFEVINYMGDPEGKYSGASHSDHSV